MKVILNQQVKIEEDSFPHFWNKEYEHNVIPRKGDFVEDSLWKEPGEYEVTEVTINYQENYCYVSLEKYSYEIPANRKDEYDQIANLHGWKTSWRR